MRKTNDNETSNETSGCENKIKSWGLRHVIALIVIAASIISTFVLTRERQEVQAKQLDRTVQRVDKVEDAVIAIKRDYKHINEGMKEQKALTNEILLELRK